MTDSLGCDLTYGNVKCLSVTTGVQRDGSYEFLIHGLAGPGVERHVHGWASVTSEGVVVDGGARLKQNVLEHVGHGIALDATTREIARVSVRPEQGAVVTVFTQQIGGTWLGTSASTYTASVKRSLVELPCSSPSERAEYSISMFDASAGVPSDSSQRVVIQFSAPLPFGIAFEVVDCR